MSEIAITYAGHTPLHDGQAVVTDIHNFVPCLQARRGDEVVLKAWIELSGYAATIASSRLTGAGLSTVEAEQALNDALLLYGVKRLEATVRDLAPPPAETEDVGQTWKLTADDVPHLLALAGDKSCEYRTKVRRDLFCLASAPRDQTATGVIDGRRAAPTSRPVCRICDLPGTDYLCSHLLHPGVAGIRSGRGIARRQVTDVMCDLGNRNIAEAQHCRAGGHSCWQRVIDSEPPAQTPISPLSLPESFDLLDAVWRLAFGRNKRLVSPSTMTNPAALSVDCTTRPEFESRLSALADIIDKLKVDDTLLPQTLPADSVHGSLDALEQCLLHQLPTEQHRQVTSAIRVLRLVRQARNALQHSITEGGGLTARLRDLGIHDAPPNWAGAWNSIRIQTADTLTTLRNELRRFADDTS